MEQVEDEKGILGRGKLGCKKGAGVSLRAGSSNAFLSEENLQSRDFQLLFFEFYTHASHGQDIAIGKRRWVFFFQRGPASRDFREF